MTNPLKSTFRIITKAWDENKEKTFSVEAESLLDAVQYSMKIGEITGADQIESIRILKDDRSYTRELWTGSGRIKDTAPRWC